MNRWNDSLTTCKLTKFFISGGKISNSLSPRYKARNGAKVNKFEN